MNIACTACSARYGVADEKLIGKRVRITCKRCGTVLIVDGNHSPPKVTASTSIPPSPPASNRPAPEVKQPAPLPEPPFVVAFPDGQQEPADVAQIVRLYRAGRLETNSLVWRDGMTDWANPWDVEEIAAAFRRMGYSRPTPAPNRLPPQRLAEPPDEEATQIHRSSPQHAAPSVGDNDDTQVVRASELGAPAAYRSNRPGTGEDDDVPTRVTDPARRVVTEPSGRRTSERPRRASSQPPAPLETAEDEYRRARREAKARSARAVSSRPPAEQPRADLFARQAQAGSEEELARHDGQVRQVNQARARVSESDAPRLTGARNESSVLFSLDSLLNEKKTESVRPARPARREDAFLLDVAVPLPTPGSIAPALSAPDFTAPVSAPPPTSLTSAPIEYPENRSRSRVWIYALAVVVLGGGGVAAWFTGALEPLLAKVGIGSAAHSAASPVATETAPAVATPTAPPQTASSEAATAASASAASASSAAPSASAPVTAAPTATATPTRATNNAVAAVTPRAPSTGTSAHGSSTQEPASPKEPSAPKEAEPKESAPAAAAELGPFDPGAAKEALSAATANVGSCKEMGGPTGTGRVSITFAPSGRPTSVAVSGDLAGTTVGSCVARLYRAVRVPAFSGEPVTVAKSFSVD